MGLPAIKTMQALLEKTEWQNGCLVWTGACSGRKICHGHTAIDGKMIKTHRLMWEMVYGPIPTGMLICHTCDNPPCLWPEHLWLGNNYQNALDRELKGRGNAGRYSHKLNATQVRLIKKSLATGALQADLAQKYLIDQTLVSQIKLGKVWAHI